MICRYTSFSCRAREGCEAGALGEPLHPEDLLGMAGGVATGTRSGSTLLEAFMGVAPKARVWKSLAGSIHCQFGLRMSNVPGKLGIPGKRHRSDGS